jgi:hypothetical protein
MDIDDSDDDDDDNNNDYVKLIFERVIKTS